VGDRGIALLLEALQSQSSHQAWAEFLDSYSPVLYQTARVCTASEDAAADCYLHICERLAQNGFRRLLKFRPDGNASFTTWLRVVARNLCFDWHRSQLGRHRPFKSLQHLSPLELEVYNRRFVRGASQEETLQSLEPFYPGVGVAELAKIEESLQNSLSLRQRWILSTRKKPEFSATVAVAGEEEEYGAVEVADSRPDQETQVVSQQQQTKLRRSLGSLPADERLLVQLRFEQDLTLEEIARLCGLGDAQRAHRKLTAVLKKLRSAMR
jgi:RNA polymerase sigma factor (sigma-70 family)